MATFKTIVANGVKRAYLEFLPLCKVTEVKSSKKPGGFQVKVDNAEVTSWVWLAGNTLTQLGIEPKDNLVQEFDTKTVVGKYLWTVAREGSDPVEYEVKLSKTKP